MPEPTFVKLNGFCPMGCGETLRGQPNIVCSNPLCFDSGAVTAILADPETEHVVRLGDDGWSMKHPLRERVSNTLLGCDEGAWIGDHGEEMLHRLGPGRFRMSWNGCPDYGFEPLP